MKFRLNTDIRHFVQLAQRVVCGSDEFVTFTVVYNRTFVQTWSGQSAVYADTGLIPLGHVKKCFN